MKYRFYKVVRKASDGTLYSGYKHNFKYVVGEVKEELEIDTDVTKLAAKGIHISTLDCALIFAAKLHNFTILEVETDIKDIIIPIGSTGQARTSKIKVVREVPLEECGVYGKILANKLRIENMAK